MAYEGGPSVSTRALRGMFWAYGSYVGGRALVLVSTAVLARLLTPADFGLVALAVALIGFLEVISDLGLTQALVLQGEEDVAERANTVWVVSVLLGLGLSLIVAALGPLASGFFDESELVVLMPVLGFNLLIRSLGSTHYALAQKRLDFRTRTKVELADVVARACVGIGLAIAGAGVWSLVIGYLVGNIAMTAALWRLVSWRPSLRPQRRHLKGMISFGGALTGVAVIAAILGSADDLIVGRVLGTTDLGLYSIAYRLPELLILNLSLVAGSVLFPAMAAIERSALSGAFLRSLRYGLMVGLPLAVGLGVLAEPFVVAIFGDKWRGAASAMQVMALWSLMSPIGIIIGTAYKSLGRADILLKLAIPQALILIPAILIVVDEGIVAVAACQAAVAMSFTLLAAFIAMRILDFRPRELWSAAWPPAAASAGLGACLVLVDRTISAPWPTLIVALAAGAAVYFGLLWLLARDTLRELFATAFPGRGDQSDPLASNA